MASRGSRIVGGAKAGHRTVGFGEKQPPHILGYLFPVYPPGQTFAKVHLVGPDIIAHLFDIHDP